MSQVIKCDLCQKEITYTEKTVIVKKIQDDRKFSVRVVQNSKFLDICFICIQRIINHVEKYDKFK